jgi:hypothetical protein
MTIRHDFHEAPKPDKFVDFEPKEGYCFSLEHDDVADLRAPKAVVSRRPKLSVSLTYPLDGTFTFEIERPEGEKAFTRASLAKAIQGLYAKVYEDPPTYGIWGHHMGDLVLEGAYISRSGEVRVCIGS